MRILVDLTYIHPSDEYSGIAIFSYSMLPTLYEVAQDIEILGLVNPLNQTIIQAHFPWMTLLCLDQRNIHALQNLNPWLNRGALDRLIAGNSVDLFFVPYFGDRCLRTSKVPTVAVMHDAQGFVFGPNRLRIHLYRLFTRIAARHVDVMVTISQYARTDILAHLPRLTSHIEVINQSLPVREYSYSDIADQYGPYILSVNTLVQYKGPLTIIKAFRRIKDEIPHKLLLKGLPTSFSENVLKPFIIQERLQDRVLILDKKFTPDQMNALYRGASLFVSASTMEGFGLTPLEASMRGIPTICADIPAVRETSLSLLRYYSPATDDAALAGQIMDMLSSPPDMSEAAGRLQEHYSPRRQALAYSRLFNKVHRG